MKRLFFLAVLLVTKVHAWQIVTSVPGANLSDENCKRAVAKVSKLADKLASEKPKVILIGEFHGILSPENIVSLIRQLVPDRKNTCLAVELPPKRAHQLQGAYMKMALAKPLGMKILFVDSAITDMGDEESMSVYGLNRRDEAMNNNIRMHFETCRQIVSINGAIHTHHVLDNQHRIPSSVRVTLADRLGREAKLIVVTEAAEACGLVRENKD
jgi:hypothetical protein